MTKIFASAAFLSIIVTFSCLGTSLYFVIIHNAQEKALKLTANKATGISKIEINNLIIAAFVGEVANINSDEKAIELKRKADVVLASYQLSSPHHYYNTHALYSD